MSEEKKYLQTINPANEEKIERYSLMSDEEVNTSIDQCHEAFKAWKTKSLEERAAVIRSVGESLKHKKEELANLMTREMGKLLKQSRQEIDLCVAICDYTADQDVKELEPIERELEDGIRGLISFEPIGVIYGIQPWNYPAYQVIRYAIVNLMAGNGVLLKHAENVTGTGLMLQEVLEAGGLPKNLFTVLKISHDQSDEVIKHKCVRGVTLTGSPDAGRNVAAKAAKELKKTVMELGSNDAYLVLEDADLELAVKKCAMGRLYNNGETCIAAKRFIVVDSIYEDFKTAFVGRMSQMKYGDPMGEEARIGPMARKDLREKLHDQVQDSVDKGAKILCGGEIPEGKGYYYPATVLENVLPGQAAYDDELFGPVAALTRAKDETDAREIANDSRFGLGGGIFTKDVDKAVELAKNHFDTGMVFINGFGLAKPNMPFGGVKDSGYGREHGGFGVREFVNTKAIMVL